MKTESKEDFKNSMRPALRDYYNSKYDYLKKALAEIIPENLTQDLLKTAIRNDHILSADQLNDSVYQSIMQYLKVQEELFRPLISCLFIEGYGKNIELFKPFLAISEIIHSSSLIVDEFTDPSILRKGNPSSHHLYGIVSAANASSALTFFTFRLIQRHLPSLDPVTRIKLYEMLLWEHYVTGIGIALNLGWAKEKITEIPMHQYLQYLSFFPGSYSYRHAARLGAIIGGADERDLKIIFQYSSLLGIACRFIEDILNLKAESNSGEKTIGEDIKEGKRSLLMLYTLKNAEPKDHHRLLQILDGNVKDDSLIKECIQIMKKYNSFEVVRKQAVNYIEQACSIIIKTKLSAEYKLLLVEFACYFIERKM